VLPLHEVAIDPTAVEPLHAASDIGAAESVIEPLHATVDPATTSATPTKTFYLCV
jgi:hypothetical protein